MPNMKKLLFCLSALAVIAILYLGRSSYWRPYNDTEQESVASIHAHGFAIANFAGLGRNPVVARHIDVQTGTVVEYNHWPNAFFLTLAAAIKLFGNTETVGRSVALLYTIPGLYLLAFAFRNRNGLSYLVVPIVICTPIGRACLPFVFVDAALLFWIGFMAAAVSLIHSNPSLSTRLFRAGAVIAPFFIQLIAPFAFFGAVARYLCGHRCRKTLWYDLLCVVGAFLLVLFFLSWTSKGVAAGASELAAQYLHRASVSMRYEENVSFVDLIRTMAKHYYLNLGMFAILLPLAYANLIRQRSPQVCLLLAALVYGVLLRNYVGIHVFANLPLISVSLFTLWSGIERITVAEGLAGRTSIALLLVISFFTTSGFSYYALDHAVNYQVRPLRSMEGEVLRSQYNCFFVQDGDNYRIPQMFCGERVVRGIMAGEKKKMGVINLEKGTLTAAE